MSEWQGGRARAPQSLRRLAAAALLLASPVAFGFERHSNDEIVRNFELVVFNEEHRDRAITRLRKWVRPVRIYLDVRVPDPSFYRRLTQATIDKLAKASGHDIRIVDNRAAANVVSTFARFDERAATMPTDAARSTAPTFSYRPTRRRHGACCRPASPRRRPRSSDCRTTPTTWSFRSSTTAASSTTSPNTT
jgi:hypothetical protein